MIIIIIIVHCDYLKNLLVDINLQSPCFEIGFRTDQSLGNIKQRQTDIGINEKVFFFTEEPELIGMCRV